MKRCVLVINKEHPDAPCIRAELRTDFWGKFLGLMFRKSIDSQSSLILDQKRENRLDSSIHMLFMNFDIAVIWVNSTLQVVDTRVAKRWALAYLPLHAARYIIEAPVDALNAYHIGDHLEFVNE